MVPCFRRSRARLAARALAVLAAAFPAMPAGAIVGGSEAPDSGRARASLMVLTSNGGVCTGIVLARDAVLTAGHCVAGAGENRIHFRDEAGAPVLRDVSARAVHPAYDSDAARSRTRSIDLALLHTREPLPPRFEPARLSTGPARAGETLTLSGYGAARATDRRSIGRYREAALGVVEPYGQSRILVWIAAAKAGGCHGDSGGPISDSTGVIAVAAWVRGACGGLTQGILLGPQRAWIDRTLTEWNTAARWASPP